MDGQEDSQMDAQPADFRQTLTYRFFAEQLNAEFVRRDFRPLAAADLAPSSETHDHRYVMRYVRDFHDIHGQRLQNEVKLVGVPLNEQVLLCHAKVRGRGEAVRVKVDCSDEPAKRDEHRERFGRRLVDRVVGLCGIWLDDLPDDAKLYIVRSLDPRSLLNLCKASHAWEALIRQNNWLWKMLYKRDFGPMQLRAVQQHEPVVSWQAAYEMEARRRRQISTKRTRWIHNALPPLPRFPALPFDERRFPALPFDERRFLPELPDPFRPFGAIELAWYDQI